MKKLLQNLNLIDISTKALSLIFFIYIFKSDFPHRRFSIFFLLIIIFSLFFNQKILSKIVFWVSSIIILSIDLTTNWYRVANHHFVLFFCCLLFFFVLRQPKHKQQDYLQNNGRSILLVLLFFASIQKLLSPTFIDGSFVGQYLTSGGFFQLILSKIESYQNYIASNRTIITEFNSQVPNATASIQLNGNPKIISTISLIYTYSILIFESLVFYVFLRVKNLNIRHYFLIGLIIAVFISRLECGFLSLLCLLGITQCNEKQSNFKLIYVFLITLFSALIILNVGFH